MGFRLCDELVVRDVLQPLGAEHLLSLAPLRGERRQVALAFRRSARLGHPEHSGPDPPLPASRA